MLEASNLLGAAADPVQLAGWARTAHAAGGRPPARDYVLEQVFGQRYMLRA